MGNITYSKQNTRFSCGAASVKNALKHFGMIASEKRIRELAGTTREHGTSDKGIVRAVTELGFKAKIHVHKTEQAFSNKLKRIFSKGNAGILLCDHQEHWVSVIKDGDIILIDSDRELKRTKILYSITQILMRARNVSKEHPKNVYYEVIEICKPTK